MTRIMPAGSFMGFERSAVTLGQAKLQFFRASGSVDEVEEHEHREPHLVFTLGPGYASCADGAPTVTGGASVIFNPAGTIHDDRFVRSGHFVSLSMTDDWLSAVLGDAPALKFPTMIQDPGALIAVRRLMGVSVGRVHERLSAESACVEALALFGGRTGDGRRPHWLKRACELLREEADVARWSVKRVADQVGVTPVHLARVFRTHMRCSPGEYVRAIRAQAAAELVAASSEPLAELAPMLGYADQSHFTRCFGQAWGVSPKVYRTLLS